MGGTNSRIDSNQFEFNSILIRLNSSYVSVTQAMKAKMMEAEIGEIEAMCAAHDAELPHHHIKHVHEDKYRMHLIESLKRALDEEKQAEDDQNAATLRYPQDLSGVHLNKHQITMHDWEVCGQIAMDKDGPNIDTLIRVHRKPGYYFWKIIFVLHMLVLLTLTSFFFPGDEEGVAIRVSISSTM